LHINLAEDHTEARSWKLCATLVELVRVLFCGLEYGAPGFYFDIQVSHALEFRYPEI